MRPGGGPNTMTLSVDACKSSELITNPGGLRMLCVTIDAFSGRENPSYFVDGAEEQDLLRDVSRRRAAITDAEAGFDGLGFSGVIVESLSDDAAGSGHEPAAGLAADREVADGCHRRYVCFPDSEKPRRLVALVVAPGFGYHWCRIHSAAEGFWGHKPAARNVDNNGQVITNPEFAPGPRIRTSAATSTPVRHNETASSSQPVLCASRSTCSAGGPIRSGRPPRTRRRAR
jgi:hypothetical protein